MFIKSQSSQSALLKLATGSEWTHVGMAFKKNAEWNIIEAVQPVKWTSLYSFIRRSKNLHFEVKRATFPFDARKVKAYAEEQLDKDYDLIFAWDNERWYCTELVYKAFKKASGDEIGTLEQIGDLNVSDPRVLAEAQRRFKSYGLAYNEAEWKKSPVITPVNMMNSPNLEDIAKSADIEGLKDCVLTSK